MFSFLRNIFLSKTKQEYLDALETLNSLFVNEPAYPRLKIQVGGAIRSHHLQDAHLMDYMNNESYSSKQKVLYLIEALVLKQLASGYYHERRGVLIPEGESLQRIYKIATDTLVHLDHYDEKDKEERLKLLDETIKAGGHSD